MRFTTLIVAAATGTGLVSAVPLEARDAPPSNQVTFADITYGGNGCPQGSVGKAISSDNQLITLFFDKYIAQAGPGTTPSQSRAACTINMKLKIPQGWQYGVFKADYRGYINIPSGTNAFAKSTYYFSGNNKQVDREVTWKGPLVSDYLKEDRIGIESTVWSPCGTEGLLNIKSSIGLLQGTSKAAQMTVDSSDFKYKQYYHLQWRKCTK